MKILRKLSLSAFCCFMSVALADDTDIYVNNSPPPGSEPLVMMAIDFRSNLTSTICANATSGCSEGDFFRAFATANLTGQQQTDYLAQIPGAGQTLTFFDVIRLSLHSVLVQVEGVKIGLMINHDNDNNCEGPSQTRCSNGAYVLRGFEALQAGDANGSLAEFMTKLYAIPLPQGNLSHPYQGKELYFEFFRYLTGGGIYNAHNGWKSYGDGNQNDNLDDSTPDGGQDVDFSTDLLWDTTIETGGVGNRSYVSPLVAANQCTKTFMLNFMFQVSQQEDDSDTAITDTKANGGMEGISLSGPNNNFDTVIEYMNDIDLADNTFGTAPDVDGIQNVVSYFIVDGSSINTTTTGYAVAGDTQSPLELDDDPAVLIDTLTNIFKEILSVSTTFVAASVPVNVFNRAESLDNVFIALFQADAAAKPYWPGNLKKLKLAQRTLVDGSTLIELADANDTAAIAADGRIKFDALTFWTDSANLPAPDLAAGEVAGKDGRVITRGAAGQKVPGYLTGGLPGDANPVSGEAPAAGPRKLFYDTAGGALAALDNDLTTRTALTTALGAADDTDANKLIRYIRGQDVNDEDTDNNFTEARPWVLGDPLHSRPLPINYGVRNSHDQANPAIYVAMGSNDGMMHFFRNTTPPNATPIETGKEVWAFMPQSVMGSIRTLMDNTPVTNPKHPYLVDGEPSVFLNDANSDGTIASTEEAFLYFGLRRGGRAYYALNITDPDAPTLAWTIDNTTTGFSELGFTWSKPEVAIVDWNNDATNDPVVIFAGGYDPNKDTRSNGASAVNTPDSMGNALYVVDARTGALIWKTVDGVGGFVSGTQFEHTNFNNSIPSNITIVDTNGDGKTDRVLYGDTGGNVWRTDIDGVSTAWQTVQLASVGIDFSATRDQDRRFFHKPDFVPSKDSIGAFDAVILGSGDRPNPLDQPFGSTDTKTTENFLYVIKDRSITPPTISAPVTDSGFDHDSFGDVTSNCLGVGTCGGSPPSLTNGFRLELEVGDGEKVLSTPLTISNVIFFTSFLPDGSLASATCGPSEGAGILYAISLADASPVLNYDATNDSDTSSDQKTDRYTTLSSAGIPADVVGISVGGRAYILPPDLQPDPVSAATRWRTFWYEVEENAL